MNLDTISTPITYLSNYEKSLSLINFVIIAMALMIFTWLTKRFLRQHENFSPYLLPIYNSAKLPVVLGMLSWLLFYLNAIFSPHFPFLHAQQTLIEYLLSGMGIAIVFWLIYNIITLGKQSLLTWAKSHNRSTLFIILPAISESLNAVFLLLFLNIIIPIIGLTGIPEEMLGKTMKVLLIATIGWILMKITSILESFILNQYIVTDNNVMTFRKIKTQVDILKRISLTLIMIVTLASILMVFDSVKNLGAGLLTTAGVLSAIGAFASQQSLSRILSGLQIAFTQPIRIGDTVVVDNEFGQVEEINLSFVTVKLWDLRRLIKPTDYFTQNGVLNLTRESTQLLGTVFIYADYTLPLEAVREKFKELINQSNFWDKNVYGLDVTDATDRSLEIRLLVSAENADLLWKLRCEMREKMIAFLVDTYPECLAKTRQVPSPAFQRMTETSNKPALDID